MPRSGAACREEMRGLTDPVATRLPPAGMPVNEIRWGRAFPTRSAGGHAIVVAVKPRLALLCAPLALMLGILSSCAMDHTAEAQALRQRIGELDGVDSVELSYENGGTLFPGTLDPVVAMGGDVPVDNVLTVLGIAYDEFESTYRSESANIGVEYGGNQVLFHADHSSAAKSDILTVAEFALAVPGPGESVEADLNARDERGFQAVESSVLVHLPPGSTRRDVPARLDRLAQTHDVPEYTDLGVLAADGAGLSGSEGLPTVDDRRAWAALGQVPFSGNVQVALGPASVEPDVRHSAHATVTITRPRGGSVTKHKQQLSRLMRVHLGALRDYSDHFTYSATVNGQDTVWFDSRHCQTDATGWQSDVDRWYFASTDVCAAP